MTDMRNPDTDAALQYLIWALEHLEKAGNQKAASHASLALAALRETYLLAQSYGADERAR